MGHYGTLKMGFSSGDGLLIHFPNKNYTAWRGNRSTEIPRVWQGVAEGKGAEQEGLFDDFPITPKEGHQSSTVCRQPLVAVARLHGA